MRKRLTKKTKIILCMLSAIIFTLLIWTIWGNTALTVSNIKISSSRIPPLHFPRPLKNILFFNIEFLMHAKNPPVLNGLMDFL